MLKRKKFWKRVFYVFATIALLFFALFVYLYIVAIAHPPKPADTSSLQLKRTEQSKGFYTLNNSWFRKSESGLYEMYVEGKPFERGVINGKLSEELVRRQEDHFSEQINRMIPSKFYLNFLKYFIAWFNRNLDKNVTEEYKEEIYGVSEAADRKYDYIGSNYQRLLNYHAAHDIGHALQNMALVGCTSFATWDARSQDSTMIIGRNFDFYVGDKFAEDKIVAFINPSEGYKFMSVTWGGFIGVVSGMNEKGLTVTLNAAKTNIPSGAATPVSLVAREILQYAKNIKEAYVIASKRKMFVAESFLIGSTEDHKAVVIEKTPTSLDMYDPHTNIITCANHFQSNGQLHTKENEQQIAESASPYRYKRLTQLLDSTPKNTVQRTIDILRDRGGINNADIGMGNEKALNQLMAHHSIVFEPQKLLVWVSTSPWQLGKYVAYDLNKVFALKGMKQDREISETQYTIAADSFLLSPAFKNFEAFRGFKQRIMDGLQVNTDSLVATNPTYYHSYVLAGDYSYKHKEYAKARAYYTTALTKVIATKKEEDHIRKQLQKSVEKSGK